MAVYKRPTSPHYHFDFQFAGVRYHGSTGCSTKAKAQAFEREKRHAAALRLQTREHITLNEACGLYQDKVQQLSSWPTMRYMLKELVFGLGASRCLSDVSMIDLQKFFSKRAKSRSIASINREIENARAVWRHADRCRFDVGAMPDWRSLKRKEVRKPPRELGKTEEVSLFEHLRSDVRDAVDFMLKSGWRRGEVLNLKWVDCDLEHGTAITRIKGGDTVRRPLTQTLRMIIERQPRASEYVFTYVCQRANGKRRRGQRYPLSATALRKPFAAALEAAGIAGFRTHDLRHTCGTRIVRQTGSLAAAKEALKHTSISTTLRYAHVMDDDVRKALEAAESRHSPD